MAKKRQENQPNETEPEKKAPKQKPKPKTQRAPGELPWHPVWRGVLSLLVLLHLTAVFSAPWNLMTQDALPPGYLPPLDELGRPLPDPPPESKLWQRPVVTRSLHGFFFHYLNLLYLNHGYEFFAPDPVGTHVMDYQVTRPDGTVIKGRLPSHEEHWPRLLYHRHMMLAEQTQGMGIQSGQHYADHLATLHGGASQMQLKQHLPLAPYQVVADADPNAPSTFRIVGTVEGKPKREAEIIQSPTDGEAPIMIPGAQQ